MSLHAYLLTLEKIKSLVNIRVDEILSSGFLQVKVNGKTDRLTIPNDQHQINRLADAKRKLNLSNSLLGKPSIDDEDSAIAMLLWEDKLKTKISSSGFNRSVLFAVLNGNLKRWEEYPNHKFETIYSAFLIREGYTLREEKGLGLIITSPFNVTNFTSPYECSCGKRDCKHQILTRSFVDNRTILG